MNEAEPLFKAYPPLRHPSTKAMASRMSRCGCHHTAAKQTRTGFSLSAPIDLESGSML